MSEDIWAFLTKDAGPDDWYTAEIRLRRHRGCRDGGAGVPIAVLRVDSRTAVPITKELHYAELDNHVLAFKRIMAMGGGQ